MAADNDKTQIQPAEGDAAAKPKKGMSKLVLFGGIGAGILIIGVVLAIFVLKPMMSGSEEAAEPKEDKKTEHAEEKKADEGHAKPKKEKKEGHGGGGESIVYAIKDIVVNPAGTAGSRFLSVSFGFELGSQELATTFEQKEPIVRDVLITILSSKTLADLTDTKQKEVMRVQIKKRLSQVLETEDLAGVYYTDFVLQ